MALNSRLGRWYWCSQARAECFNPRKGGGPGVKATLKVGEDLQNSHLQDPRGETHLPAGNLPASCVDQIEVGRRDEQFARKSSVANLVDVSIKKYRTVTVLIECNNESITVRVDLLDALKIFRWLVREQQGF